MSHYYRHSYPSRRRSGGRSRGYEDAKRHIREAEELSRELGGTDEDVKRYFFNLPSHEMEQVLSAYGRKYGAKPEAYARETLQLWRSGARTMSGMVAARLFNLLPPKMPLAKKYELVENLWQKYSPKSRLYVTVGPDAELDDFVVPIRKHLEQEVLHYTIPEPLEARFSWLAQGDVAAKQDLLNHLLQQERALITKGLETKMPILLRHMKDFQQQTRRLVEQITIGSHKVEVCFLGNQSGVSFSTTRPVPHTSSGRRPSGSGCLVSILALAATVMLMVWLAL